MGDLKRYGLSGLVIESEFPLLHIDTIGVAPSGPADVVIRAGSEVEMGEGWINRLITPTTTPADILSQPLPDLRMRIRDGNSVLVHCSNPLSPGELSVYLTGLAWGLICHQRGLLPLHCSAIVHAGHAFAFTGPMQAGKSTLVHGLTRRGYDRCCDDIMITAPGTPPRIRTMASGCKLWDDAIAFFGEEQGVQNLRVRGDRQKFHVPGGAIPDGGTRPLAALYVLEIFEGDPAVVPLTGYAAWGELYRSIYRIDMVPWIRSPIMLAREIDTLARSLPVFAFRRPRDFNRFDDGVRLIESHLDAIVSRQGGSDVSAVSGNRALGNAAL